MPPTYSPFWKPFEILGRLGLPRRRIDAGPVEMGPPEAVDASGGDGWRQYVTAPKLYDLWGPPHDSRWSGYHKPTLFAAIDGITPERLRPCGLPSFGVPDAPRRTPDWADERTAIALDLPGPFAVAYGAWLAGRGRHVPIATFNNWPHAQGLVDATSVLAALLYYSPWIAAAELRGDERIAPPVLLLDRARLGRRAPRPNDFDNRYFLLETDLPPGAQLAAGGIERLVYVRPDVEAQPAAPAPGTMGALVEALSPPRPSPSHPEMDDVNGWLHDLGDRVRVHLATASLVEWAITDPAPFAPAVRKTPFSTTSDPAFRGFRRNAAGGFGKLVPEPSSGGG